MYEYSSNIMIKQHNSVINYDVNSTLIALQMYGK